MCYNHLPRNLPELQQRIGLSHDNPPDEIDMKDSKVVHGRQNGAEQWKAFLRQIGSEGDPMALCNIGYCYFNGARSSVGIIFVEKNIDAPAGTSTGTEIADFVRDPKAKWDMDLTSAIDLYREGELEVGDRVIAVDGMDVNDENIYALLSADDIPGSTLTITVQKKSDVEAHRQDKHHKSQPPKVFKICRSERVASKRDQVKQKAIDVWKKAAERGELTRMVHVRMDVRTCALASCVCIIFVVSCKWHTRTSILTSDACYPRQCGGSVQPWILLYLRGGGEAR